MILTTCLKPNCLYIFLGGVNWCSSVWEPRGPLITSVWLTQFLQCPRCGRGSHILALCPWWTSWLQLADSLAGFHQRSLAGGHERRNMSQQSHADNTKSPNLFWVETNLPSVSFSVIFFSITQTLKYTWKAFYTEPALQILSSSLTVKPNGVS